MPPFVVSGLVHSRVLLELLGLALEPEPERLASIRCVLRRRPEPHRRRGVVLVTEAWLVAGMDVVLADGLEERSVGTAYSKILRCGWWLVVVFENF